MSNPSAAAPPLSNGEVSWWKIAWPGLLLSAVVVAVYAQTATFGFSDYDDTIYVSANPVITAGLTWDGVKEVVVHGQHLLWTPLTSLSYMLGCQIHGLSGAGHHLTNVALHIVAVWLVFFALWRYTGARGLAWFVAAVFALHPLNAESVAWVSGRKNELYAIFWMLSLLAYRRYALAPSLARYAAVLALHLAGLASKPTHLMLPLVLLLLDLWPLQRIDPTSLFTSAGFKRALWLGVEKLPLLALSIAVSVFTFGMVEAGGGLRDLGDVPLSSRLQNTAYVYAFYVVKLFCPTGLTIHYPYPVSPLPTALVLGSIALLVVLTALSIVSLFRDKVFFVAWWWYVLVLLPESGLLRANSFLMADRYAYISTIGLILAVAWYASTALESLSKAPSGFPLGKRGLKGDLNLENPALALLFGLILTTCALFSAWQTRFWKNDEALWRRAVTLYPEGPVGHDNLGVALRKAGRVDEAAAEFETALTCPGPFKVSASMNLGAIAFERNDDPKAAAFFEEVIQRNPTYVPGLLWAARVRARNGDADGAAKILDRAAVLAPADKEVVAALNGRAPNAARGWANLGAAFQALGRPQDAAAPFARALALNPDEPDALLGSWSMKMSLGDPTGAEPVIRHYLDLRPNDATAWAALAMNLAELNRRDDALSAAQKALSIDPAQPQALEVSLRLQAK